MQRSEQNIRRAAGDAILGIVLGIASLLIGLGALVSALFVLDAPGRRIAFGAWTAAVGLMVAGLGSMPLAAQFATFVFVCAVARRALN